MIDFNTADLGVESITLGPALRKYVSEWAQIVGRTRNNRYYAPMIGLNAYSPSAKQKRLSPRKYKKAVNAGLVKTKRYELMNTVPSAIGVESVPSSMQLTFEYEVDALQRVAGFGDPHSKENT